ncbi:flavin mononucleotide hydrolase 1, chloroplatic isoform X2 [Hordeum vulgare subsp. vulgare]|uniref:flavin mononucleotide hydrolase 1, chloroplatic isoform X2 n=1 Tax=Hordeum vulgare subsp. vulgare TaxID=112509 RepID=UPI000B46B960|nr:flavin mononucleotide hydrolase 1, chloroplatic isoform X2 [Hordeum vulgare subsp. vulgare]
MVSLLPRAPYLASLGNPTARASSSSLRLPAMSSSAPAPAPAATATAAAVASETEASRPRKMPVLLFDVMDTVVRDPFYHHIPSFFQMSMKELLESKHPTSWSEFEKGMINEGELAEKFFNDGRSFDLEGLKACMVRAYEYVDGVEDILCSLKQNNYELIEEKLKLSKYLSWTFCSCHIGIRKPSPDFYLHAVDYLNIDPGNCIFIDDRMVNIEAALSVGMVGLHFKNAEALKNDLCSLGVELAPLVPEDETEIQ